MSTQVVTIPRQLAGGEEVGIRRRARAPVHYGDVELATGSSGWAGLLPPGKGHLGTELPLGFSSSLVRYCPSAANGMGAPTGHGSNGASPFYC